MIVSNVAWLRSAENGQTNVGVVGGDALFVTGTIEEVAAKILAGYPCRQTTMSAKLPAASRSLLVRGQRKMLPPPASHLAHRTEPPVSRHVAEALSAQGLWPAHGVGVAMAFSRPWSFTGLATWLQARGWFGFGRSKTAPEDACRESHIEIDGHTCTVWVAAEAKAKLLTVILAPPFCVKDQKTTDALLVVNELNCRISEGRFVLFRGEDGFQQLRYWHSVAHGQLATTEVIAPLVGRAACLYAEWLLVLEAVSLSDEPAVALLDRIKAADRSRLEEEKRAAGLPIVITGDDYQERLGEFLDASYPSDTSTYDAYLLWVKNQTLEFDSFLRIQGIEVETAIVPSWVPGPDDPPLG